MKVDRHAQRLKLCRDVKRADRAWTLFRSQGRPASAPDPFCLLVLRGCGVLASRGRAGGGNDGLSDVVAKAWTNIALVDGDVTETASEELAKPSSKN